MSTGWPPTEPVACLDRTTPWGENSFMRISFSCRARPDWAYEFPDRTGPDTQICRTVPLVLHSYTKYHINMQEMTVGANQYERPCTATVDSPKLLTELF